MDIKDHIRAIPDFPKPGILFYDISTLLAHPDAWQVAMGRMAKIVGRWSPDVLAGIESRGFLAAAPLALKLGCGFTMVRKAGKLPGPTVSHSYDLEYGTDTVEIQSDAVAPGQRVVILDDLLATGGTLSAAVELFRKQGAEVAGALALQGYAGDRPWGFADPRLSLVWPIWRDEFPEAVWVVTGEDFDNALARCASAGLNQDDDQGAYMARLVTHYDTRLAQLGEMVAQVHVVDVEAFEAGDMTALAPVCAALGLPFDPDAARQAALGSAH